MTDNINIEKPLPVKTYSVNKVNEKLKRLENAIESIPEGITSAEVQTMINTSLTDYPDNTDLSTALADKQDVLTAGVGIDITNNVISCDNVVPSRIYKRYESYDWSVFIEPDGNAARTTKDLKLVIHTEGHGLNGVYYMPKHNYISGSSKIPIGSNAITESNKVSIYTYLFSSTYLFSNSQRMDGYYRDTSVITSDSVTFTTNQFIESAKYEKRIDDSYIPRYIELWYIDN